LLEYRTVKIDPDYRVGSDGSAWSHKSGEWIQLGGCADKDGYLTIEIAGKRHKVHILILEAFVGPRPPKMEGCHKNDIKTDNRLENLVWGTHRENFEHAVANGLVVLKLDAVKAVEIVKLKSQGLTNLEIGDRLGVSGIAVQKVLCGKLWSEATGIPPRKKDDFEGPGRATKIALLHYGEWTPQEIKDFLEVSEAEVYGVLTGRAWGRVTGIEKQPTRSSTIKALEPEVIRLRQEGHSCREVADRLGISLRKVQYIAATAA
jgi:DNA-binding CsgD family transcriptional regulator